MSSVDGILLLHKPEGVTSFEVLHSVKVRFQTQKVGHAGTLDRFAKGLLVVVLGSYTRLVDLLQNFEKEYLGTIEFGKETDTLDPEGRVVAEGPIPTLEEINAQIPSFLGTISQRPPVYSAVHVDGERAYRMARRGVAVEPPLRLVEIRSIRIENYRPPHLALRIVCSKGTYIRSLARDLGRKCGSVAYLTELTRLRIGTFQLNDAVLPTDLERKARFLPVQRYCPACFPVGYCLPLLPLEF